jgi:hypothetical protein
VGPDVLFPSSISIFLQFSHKTRRLKIGRGKGIGNGEGRAYTTTSWIPIIAPRPTDLIPLLDDYEIPAVAFTNHLDGGCHARNPRPDDQDAGAIGRSAIIDCGIGFCHVGMWLWRIQFSENSCHGLRA